jgi:hypothetical protein
MDIQLKPVPTVITGKPDSRRLYHCYSSLLDEQAGREIFEATYGQPPEVVFSFLGTLWVGPVPEMVTPGAPAESAPVTNDAVTSQPEYKRVRSRDELQLELSL